MRKARTHSKTYNTELYTRWVIGIKDFLRDLGPVPPGIHGILFNVAVCLGLTHSTLRDEAALGPADQTHLLQLFLHHGQIR